MKKYAIKTYGCKLNQAESGNLEEVLNLSFKKSNFKEADLIIINSCGVIKKTELRIKKRIKEFKKKGKTVILTGCLPSIVDDLKGEVDLILKGNDPKKFEKLINNYFNLKKENNYKKIPTKIESESCSAIVSVSSGCLGSCTYCATKFARKDLVSYSEAEIINKIEELLSQGIKEIQLTSQDLAIYGKEKGDFLLVDLLKKIIHLDYKFRVKLGMMNIRFLKNYLDDFLDLFTSPKIYNFLHIPIQSGSDKILQDMNRKHTVKDFINLVEAIRRDYNDFTIATDIIVGFPTESDKFFDMSYNLLKEYNLSIVNITRYSERENTLAAKMKDMPSKIKKERSRKLAKLTKKQRLKENKKKVGNVYPGLIIRKGKNNTKLARLNNGKAVILEEGKIGTFNKIKIEDYKHNYLIGRIYD